ncbi:hypothetical protein Tco_0247672 [Tanacetum coccineum]
MYSVGVRTAWRSKQGRLEELTKISSNPMLKLMVNMKKDDGLIRHAKCARKTQEVSQDKRTHLEGPDQLRLSIMDGKRGGTGDPMFSTFLEKPNFGNHITFGEEIASYIEGETVVLAS